MTAQELLERIEAMLRLLKQQEAQLVEMRLSVLALSQHKTQELEA